MFSQVLAILHYPEYTQGNFNANPFVNRALGLTNNHWLIEQTRDYEGIDILTHFDRYQLLQIWMNNDCSFTTKVLLTMWWGGLSHQFQAPRFYANMEELQEKLQDLEAALLVADPANLTNLFNSLSNGDLHLNGIKTSFFTKIFQFYFHSRNLTNNQNLIVPIICDKWSSRALWYEMRDTGNIEMRNEIFTNNDPENLRLRIRNGSKAESYVQFIMFFNERLLSLQHDYPGLTAFDLEAYIFGWRGNADNDINPRHYN